MSRPRIWVVTSRMDIVIELLLLAQIVFGLWIALGYRWGYYWFASDMSPYLWSILKLNPQTEAVSAMPLVIKTHIVGAFVIVGMIPFTRLVHFLVVPFHYIWRPYQQVIWYWDRKRVRDPLAPWTETRPRNN
jgi:nitrate reductase gamma subunit